MHIAPINRSGFDRDCRVSPMASNDRTVRSWSLPDGGAKRVLRWPIAQGDSGKTHATAVFPKGKLVAVGGWDARNGGTKTEAVAIFDAANGEIVASIGGPPDVVDHLAFSRDGRWLAVAQWAGGVPVVEETTWRIVEGLGL